MFWGILILIGLLKDLFGLIFLIVFFFLSVVSSNLVVISWFVEFCLLDVNIVVVIFCFGSMINIVCCNVVLLFLVKVLILYLLNGYSFILF